LPHGRLGHLPLRLQLHGELEVSTFAQRRRAVRIILAISASAALLTGCAIAGQGPDDGNAAADAAASSANALASEKNTEAAERDAMTCVTGAWVATTGALQALFDEAIAESG